LLVVFRDVRLKGRRVGRIREPESPRERPPTLRQREAFRVAVQVRTTAVRDASRVGEQGSVDHDDAQQV
jgi:hypothetical protein